MTDKEKWQKLYNSADKYDIFLKTIKEVQLPCIEAMKLYNQNTEHHPEGLTIYDHVMKVLQVHKSNNRMLNLALLFHDIGKPLVAEKSPNGDYYRFYNHDTEGELYCKELAEQYGWDQTTYDIISFCCRHHMRFHHIISMKPSKIFKLTQMPYYEYLVLVAFADEKCRGFSTFNDTWNERMDKIQEVSKLYGETVYEYGRYRFK